MCMAKAVVDLKMIVQQDRSLVLEVLELGNTLVFDVKAEHRWTTHALETYGQLSRIFDNLVKLMGLTEGDWDKGAELFTSAAGNKLWTTAVALWRALPPIRAKYTEILARRRRQRIMGAEIEEVEGINPDEVKLQHERLAALSNSLRDTLKDLQQWIDKLPAGLVPELSEGEEVPVVDATQVEEQSPSGEVGAEGETVAAEDMMGAVGQSVAVADGEGGTLPETAGPVAPVAYSPDLVDTDEFSPI